MEVEYKQSGFSLDENTLSLQFWQNGCQVAQCHNESPYLLIDGEKLPFTAARQIKHTSYRTGTGVGVKSTYSNIAWHGKQLKLTFSTKITLEFSSETFYLEFIPECELDKELKLEALNWPASLELTAAEIESNTNKFCPPPTGANYSVIPYMQGLLIPDTWPETFPNLPFDGRFGTEAAYLPWFAQFKGQTAYMAIVKTAANAKYKVTHQAYEPTEVELSFEPSLGQLAYKRVVQLVLFTNADYNTACAYYRKQAKAEGRFLSLSAKAALNKKVADLVGSFFVHCGIKTHIQPESDMYVPSAPTKNERLVTFKEREQDAINFVKRKIKKLYMHLDGWAEPGYDNEHPDFYPACEKAGGFEGMRQLIQAMHKAGYLFGIHDQYRDFYFKAPSFDKNQACQQSDGSIYEHKRWAGGRQSYLCASVARQYVRRNFTRLKDAGITLDAAYLDVFTCNEGDECYNPEHLMSRADCYKYRCECFDYLTANGIIPSSEEVNDWAVRSLVFCHYAPYDFMLRKPGAPKYGLPVPLFNLVYHDSLIIPWMMEKHEKEDYMLYALLNGGAPYYIRDAAYPNIDGAFKSQAMPEEMQRERCQVVADLHAQVAYMPLREHHFLNQAGSKQVSVFANEVENKNKDLTKVLVDFTTSTYKITSEGGKTAVREADRPMQK